MANATFEGTIVQVFKKPKGIAFTLCEKPHWDCQEKTYFRLAAWGKIAANLARKLKPGRRFKFTCKVEINTVGGTTYTNFIVKSWGEVIQPRRTFTSSKPERSDDWFVPSPRDRDSASARRFEGFPS